MNAGSIYMLLAVVFFSITHASVKAVPHIPFFELVFFRAVITLVITSFVLKKKGIPYFGNKKNKLLLRGFFGTVALCAYFYTLQVMPLATAVTIQYLSPILTLIIATVFLKESASKNQWIYFLLAFVGVLLVKGLDPRVTLFDFLVGIGAALGSAIAYNLVRSLRTSEHELVIVFYFPLVTIPLVSPLVLSNWVMPKGLDWLFIFLIGIFTQLAQVYMTKSYKEEKAARVGIYNYLGLIIAIAVGFLFFDETLHWLSAIGMLVIFVAILGNSKLSLKKVKLG